MKLADSFGVPRHHFIDEYFGNEPDQTWLDRMAASCNKKWVQFIRHERQQIDQIRADIHALASETGLEITATAASSRPCRRASASPIRPRRKWSKPTFAW
jgi:hypothetical protein